MLMHVILDNGHGIETKGKRSPVLPDGSQLLEWKYTREIARQVMKPLRSAGVDCFLLVPGELDVSLKKRAQMVNELATKFGSERTILDSIHCNAAGDGSKWMTARGWEAWTSIGETKADKLADCFCDEAMRMGFKVRKDMSDGDPDKEDGLYILKHTLCPAVLTENFFMDNMEDCKFMLSEKGREAIAALHVRSITKYIEDYA
mgnify:CR=1 FL=1